MNIRNRIIVAALLLAASTGAWSRQPRSIDLADIAKDPSLIGKRVTLHACILLPMSDNPDGGEEFVLLYPCGTDLDNGPPEGVIAGTFIEDESILQPFADAKITFEGEVQADLTGKLSRRRLDDIDPEKHVVLTIERVANPTERMREEE